MKINLSLKLLAALSISGAMSLSAQAHSVAIGHSNGAAAGSVNLFLGSYHYDNKGDGPNIEGSALLTGPGGYNTTTLFDTSYASGALPSNLVIGNVSFYPGYSLSSLNSWEAVTISGLTTAGTYVFQYLNASGGSAHWAPFSTTQSFNLTAADVAGGGVSVSSVPEPDTLALIGLGLVAFAFKRRKIVQQTA